MELTPKSCLFIGCCQAPFVNLAGEKLTCWEFNCLPSDKDSTLLPGQDDQLIGNPGFFTCSKNSKGLAYQYK